MNEELQKGNSVFLIELDKIEVNPYQPRIEFDEEKIKALAESIKQYGIIQPIVVSRKEEYSEEFGIRTKYQIIAGERRFRASKLIGLNQIPAIIRTKEDTDAEKLELAIIENLQREDLNPVDKAKAFRKLADDFGLKHAEIAKKMGKSREYVSNAMRILMLPDNILSGLTTGKISEGHTRSLLMLKDRPAEQVELYKRIIEDKLTVRAAEKLARNIAVDKIRKKVDLDPEIKEIENHIREKLGTKVSIDQKPIGDGGKLTIEFFNKNDLRKILSVIESESGVVESFSDNKENNVSLDNGIEKEINNFDDIQPTVFREEIEKIEQFSNSNNPEKEINNFEGFTIGENNNDISEKNNSDLESKVGENIDFLKTDTKISNNFQDEINKELEKIQTNPEINNFSENNNFEKVEGLEKIEIKNDFDRTRVDSFAKTDEILKSFNSESVKSENNYREDINVENSIKPIDKIQENNLNNSSEENEYSDLYAEFLKSKNSIEQKSGTIPDENKVVDIMDNELKINSADNIVVEKEPEDLSKNIITGGENIFQEKEEDIEPVVDIITQDSSDFMVAAEEHKKNNNEIIKEDDYANEDVLKKDDKYSFKGFSL